MEFTQRREQVLTQAACETDWRPRISGDDGDMLRSLMELGWVELAVHESSYQVVMTERGWDRFWALGAPGFTPQRSIRAFRMSSLSEPVDDSEEIIDLR